MRKPPTGASGTYIRPGRVLVIDDEALLGDAIRRALGRDHRVVAVSEAAEALARLQNGERYDVVLCDVMMPGMDGIEFHRRLSLVLPDEAARIVFITGCAVTARVDAFFNRAANLLLEKPVDLEGLRALVERRVSGPSEEERGARHAT
ncbi:MAG TPA: response regulator [Polyangiaceae bacterium]